MKVLNHIAFLCERCNIAPQPLRVTVFSITRITTWQSYMMQSWKRELCRPGRVAGGRERPKGELELTKMDTLIIQVSRVNRAVTEVTESCFCLEKFVSKEEKYQAELESELKVSSTLSSLRNQQHSLTKINLQGSIQLIRGHIEREERENRRMEEEIGILLERMEKIKESKFSQLKEIKDRYGNELVDKEKIEQQKRMLELKHKKNILTTCIIKLKQKKQKKDHTDWKEFVEVVIKMAKLQQNIIDEYSSLQQYKDSIQMLQTAVVSMQQINSSTNISKKHVEEMSQVMNHISPSSLHIKQPDLISARTTDGGPAVTSSSTYLPHIQGQSNPMSRCTFATSFSFLKLPPLKFGEKKISNCSRNTQNCSRGTLKPSVSEDSQVTFDFSSQAQHQKATSDCLNNSAAPITELNKMSHFSSAKNLHHPREKIIWSQTPSDNSVSNFQETNRCTMKPISFSPSVISSANAQSFETSTHRPRYMSGTSFIPQDIRVSSPSIKTLNTPPKVCKDMGMSALRFKSVRIPFSVTKCAETSVSRGLGVPHLKLRDVRGEGLLSRCASVPSSRGAGVPSSQPKSFGICSPAHYQKPYQKFSSPCLDNNELSRLSLSSKPLKCKEALQEFHPSSDNLEETLNKNDNIGHSVSVSTSVTTTDGLIRSSSHTLPTDQDNAASSHHVSHPMEVDDNKSSEVEDSPLSTSQEFKITDSSTTNETQMQVSSPKVIQHLHSYNKSLNEVCPSSFIKSSSTKDISHFSEHSEQNNTPITSTPEKSMNGKPDIDYVPPASVASLSTYVPSSHGVNTGPNKAQFQSKFSSMKTLSYKQSPVTSDVTNHSSQQFSSNSPVENSKFPFIFDNGLQANTAGNKPFNLFGSPAAESAAQGLSENTGSNFFMFQDSSNLRENNTSSGLFNLNLGSDGESMEHSNSGFLSSIFDSSPGTNSSSDENTGFRLF